jgi:hypothetical protein
MFQLVALLALSALPAPQGSVSAGLTNDPLMDWSPWQKYRATVIHPATTVKAADLARAQENIRRYAWARQYRDGLVDAAKDWPAKLTPEYLTQMIPATTPGEILFTPCPACRELGKPLHPHGQWRWSAEAPEKLVCAVCGAAFPNDKYPENIVLHAHYGGGQSISYCGGPPFRIFGYVGRPSFTAAIRAHKVNFMAGLCRRLAEAYALGGDPQHARAVRRILLRLAETYPGWLVHTGYGEYADLDPHLAAGHIQALPADELCPPPNVPDRRLYSGFWQGGRARGVGMEGGFLRQVVEAYDFVCDAQDAGSAVFSDADRLKIEKDLLLEGTVLLAADKAVNNKSVGNAAAVALVGMSLGHPEMVRFGLEVFQKTVDGWFLSDGGTPESWGYATMTLSGIESLGQAFRGYSDPPAYRDLQGRRLDRLDLYHQTAYRKVWAAMFNGLQGDLMYPPLADSHVANGLGARFAELMADNYPENPQYLALLKALAGNDSRRGAGRRGKTEELQLLKTQTGDDLSRGDRQYALYYRPPELEKRPAPPLCLADYVFPVLSIGYLRSGPHGRDSALVLSASDWGNHHHHDSLNLYYWREGQELLSDLGYLWDHPQREMTTRTLAHNTVLVNGQEQIAKGRGGRFLLFQGAGRVKVMEAESRAYAQASLYRRCVAQVEHAPGRQYVADIFRVRGGARHDYVFHGPGNDLVVDGPPLGAGGGQIPAAYDLRNVRGSQNAAPWKITWKIAPDRHFAALWFNGPEETTLLGSGWGQRDYRNTDVGAVLPYVVRRRAAGEQASVYAGVFEDFAPGQAICRSVRPLATAQGETGNTVALAVQTDRGADYLVSSLQPRLVRVPTVDGLLEVCARFAAVSIQQGQVAFSSLVEGSVLRWNGKDLTESRKTH